MNKFVLYLSIVVLLFSCASAKNGKSAGIDGNWELSTFPGATKSFDEIFGQRRPQLQFSSGKGAVTGTTGCNRLSGNYTANADHLTFGSNFVTTRMACSDYDENVFLQALNKVNRFEIKDTQLQLMHDNDLVMSLVKH